MTTSETPTIVQAVDHYDSPRVQTRIRARARRLSNVAVLAVAIGSGVTGVAAASTASYGFVPGSMSGYVSNPDFHVHGEISCPDYSTWTITGSVKQGKVKGNTKAGDGPSGYCGPGMQKAAFDVAITAKPGMFELTPDKNNKYHMITVKLKSSICTVVSGKSKCKNSRVTLTFDLTK